MYLKHTDLAGLSYIFVLLNIDYSQNFNELKVFGRVSYPYYLYAEPE